MWPPEIPFITMVVTTETGNVSVVVRWHNVDDKSRSESLERFLGKYTKLVYLKLFSSDTQDSSSTFTLSVISDFIGRCSSLTSLDMCQCKIGSREMAILTKGIEKSQSLTSLSLCDNRIYGEGAQKFYGMLKSNTTLQNLSLRNALNSIQYGIPLPPRTRDMVALSRAVSSNTTLRKLDLSGVTLKDKQRELLIAMAESNHSLLSFTLDGSDDDEEDRIANAIRRNYIIRLRKSSLMEQCIHYICSYPANHNLFDIHMLHYLPTDLHERMIAYLKRQDETGEKFVCAPRENRLVMINTLENTKIF